MAGLRIPEAAEPGLREILSLTDELAAELRRAIEASGLCLNPHNLSAKIALGVMNFTPEQVQRIVSTLASLYAAASTLRMTHAQVASAVADVIASTEAAKFGASAEQLARLRSRLTEFLSLDAVSTAAKAIAVWTEHERSFCSARVMTDIRPVFGVDPNERPIAAGIVHTLRISCHVTNGLEEIYIALDSDDVRTLRYLLDRAEQKADSLKRMLHDAGIRHFDSPE